MLASQNGIAADTKVVFHACPEGTAFYEADLETGAVYPVTAEKSGNDYTIDAPLSPWSARIFAASSAGLETDRRTSAVTAFTRPSAKTLKLNLDMDKEMKVSIAGPNVYRLEDLTVSIGDGPAFASKPNTFIEHLKASGSIGAAYIKFNDGFGIPQRLSVNYPIPAVYHFEFTIDEAGSEVPKVSLLRDRMGIMGSYQITVNGQELPAGAFKPLRIYDQNNLAADITDKLKGGINTIAVKVTAAEDWHGLSDPLFLLGNFGVLNRDGKFIIGKPPAAALPTAKAVKGYPFYSGKFTFETELEVKETGAYEDFTLELPEKYRIYECVRLSLNGQDLGVRGFSPYIWQGKATLLKKGANQLSITIANTLGNMFEGCYYDYQEQKTVYIR
jgi:hypothetical protein